MKVLIIITPIVTPGCQVLDDPTTEASDRYLEVLTPKKIKKQLLHASMVVILFGFEVGSRQREGMELLSALPSVTLYLFSNSGFAIRVPKSLYSSFHILALTLSETRASSGKLDETNR